MKQVYRMARAALFLLMLKTAVAHAQNYSVTGTVKDARTGYGMAGVNVIVKGTPQGAITDSNGGFVLNVPSSPATLQISFIGYRTTEVQVSTSVTSVNILLEEDVTSLEEVVISGLATTVKRTNLANAVASVDGKELMGTTNPQTLDYALYGKLTGVNMNSNGGAPGGGVNVNLRGISTLGAGASQPLYIIDGVYMNNSAIRNGRSEANQAGAGSNTSNQDDAANRLADLNPDDIERVEVLKGPSAAAIYGTRANAGVVIITTKKGKQGKTKLTFSQDLGFAKAQNLNFYEPWNEDKVVYYQTEYLGNVAAIPAEVAALNQAIAEGRNLDLEKEMYGETGFLTNTQISLSGGNEKTSFFVSGGLQDEDGIIKFTGFKRYSIRANIDHSISDRIKFGLNTNYIKTDNQRGFTGNQNNTGGSLGYAIAYTRSYRNLKPDANGNYPDNPDFNDNPFAIRDLAENNQFINRFITSGNLSIGILQKPNYDLKFVVNGGVDYMGANTKVYMPEILQHQRALPNPGDVIYGNQNDLNSNIQGFLVFNLGKGETNFSTQAGAVRLDQNSKYQLIRGQGLNGGQSNLAYAQVVSNMSQINQKTSDVGIYAQQEVNWGDKLIGTLGVRLDKSTLNLDQDKFYSFYKGSLAANISNFGFWNVEAVNQFKLRMAYGQSGGLPLYNRTFVVLNSQLIGGEIGFQVGTRDVDPNLRPEIANELEFGIDAGFLENKISLEASYYIKNVNDLIIDLVPAESTGINAIATNGADLQNKGIELALGATPVSNNQINWFTRVAWWKNRAEITNLKIPAYTFGGFGTALGTYIIAEGFSPTTIVGTPVDVDNPTPVPGVRVIGDRQADFDMSWYNSVTLLKNFELSFLLHYKKGGDNINLSALLWDDGGSTQGYMNDPDGDGLVFGLGRLLDWVGTGQGRVPATYIQDATYLKLREVGLYYNVPKTISSGWFNGAINNIKVGFSANNILLSTKYGSYDPEVSNFGAQPINSNVEVTPYPSSRRYFFHLTVDF
ncbi:MAG: SusC/RagA family TonB-linked outer membrane protein [Cyclobacteriaceae bacterium]